ncbi:hypothetical protein GHT06_020113 [Daphnia sinensis]|uniref:Uncharacterized protein n=1 Tax=Daphnia sinensis TaxID=1820382 RepID=A0AAD5PP73_9CRUS|nr:hypothetical protein GHT06_020113 [Daphnia sinensis]
MLIGWSPGSYFFHVSEVQSEDKEPHHRNNTNSKFSITSYSHSKPPCELCSLG